MQIVINMPEEMYERIKAGYVPLGILKYLRNGTPLPKGHGRLIDAGALLMDFAFANNKSAGECVHDAPTIIDADKESD